jgi:hypothetical protein
MQLFEGKKKKMLWHEIIEKDKTEIAKFQVPEKVTFFKLINSGSWRAFSTFFLKMRLSFLPNCLKIVA